MKKLFLILGVAILSLTSCVKDEQNVSSDGIVASQLKFEASEMSTTRAEGVARYVAEAYLDEAYTTPAFVFNEGADSSVVVTSDVVNISLDSSEEYYFLLWADDGASYAVEDLSAVSLVDGQEISEAWYGQLTIANSNGATHTAVLNRAVSKVNFIEVGEFCSPELTASFDGYTGFSVATCDVVGEKSAFEVTYIYTDPVSGILNTDPLYLFAPVATSDVMDITFTDVEESYVVTNIPVQANYVTNINGHYTGLIQSVLSISKDGDWDYDPVLVGVVTFVDPAFEAAILDALGMIAGNTVTVDDALTLTSLTISSCGITDMTGINAFTNLTSLDCSSNELTAIDISALSNLTSFKCGNNYDLVDITLPDDPSKIETYYVFRAAITEIEILTKMTGLKTLYAYDMPNLTTIDFRNCSSMTTGNVARCYALETVYLNKGQTDSGSWVFKEITTCTFICTDEDGHDEYYGSGEINGTWS